MYTLIYDIYVHVAQHFVDDRQVNTKILTERMIAYINISLVSTAFL